VEKSQKNRPHRERKRGRVLLIQLEKKRRSAPRKKAAVAWGRRNAKQVGEEEESHQKSARDDGGGRGARDLKKRKKPLVWKNFCKQGKGVIC